MEKIGEIVHYFTDLEVGIIELSGNLKVGDTIKIEGATTDFEQTVPHMEIDHEEVEEATPGQEVGVKVDNKVREGDEVFLV